MNTKLVNSAALTQNRTAAGIALALDSARMLMTPEVAAELEQLRARIAELEAAQKPSETYPPALPWAALMDSEDLADFLDELAASAITHASNAVALAEVEATCGRWRVIAEAQHAHNTAPGPDIEADGIARRIVPVQALREDDPCGLHHDYRLGRDLPEMGGV